MLICYIYHQSSHQIDSSKYSACLTLTQRVECADEKLPTVPSALLIYGINLSLHWLAIHPANTAIGGWM